MPIAIYALFAVTFFSIVLSVTLYVKYQNRYREQLLYRQNYESSAALIAELKQKLDDANATLLQARQSEAAARESSLNAQRRVDEVTAEITRLQESSKQDRDSLVRAEEQAKKLDEILQTERKWVN